MKKITLKNLLLITFRVSLRGMNDSMNPCLSFSDWVECKSRYNYRLNRIVFKYINGCGDGGTTVGGTVTRIQTDLAAISNIILDHFRHRSYVFSFLSKFGVVDKRVFSNVSLIVSVVTSIIKSCWVTMKAGRSYGVDHNVNHGCCVLTVNFPSHAYAMCFDKEGNSGSKIYSSLGEHLSAETLRRKSAYVISCGEHVRQSKKNEHSNGDCSLQAEKIPRLNATLTFHPSQLFSDANLLFVWVLRNSKDLYMRFSIFVENYRLYVDSLKWRRLFRSIETSSGRVDAIYINLFSNALGSLMYEGEYCDRVVTYSYSENVYIPPSSLAGKAGRAKLTSFSCLREIPLHAFTLSGNSVGCVDAFGLVESSKAILIRNYKNQDARLCEQKDDEIPCVLGFEQCLGNIKFYIGKTIAVFDVPPETKEVQLRRALAGDMSCDMDFILSFLAEICCAVEKVRARIIFKPKYSLENYKSEYESYINEISQRLGDRFVVVSPYIRLQDMMDISDISLSLPYTSTKAIAEYCGVESYYFVPSAYKSAFNHFQCEGEALFGTDDLVTVIRSK